MCNALNIAAVKSEIDLLTTGSDTTSSRNVGRNFPLVSFDDVHHRSTSIV
jgi:hypothetical protein